MKDGRTEAIAICPTLFSKSVGIINAILSAQTILIWIYDITLIFEPAHKVLVLIA